MQRKKLEKLQKHLRTLNLFEVRESNDFKMSLTKKNDKTRFAIRNWQFDCGMPACIGGHAKHLFRWRNFKHYYLQFEKFFNLSYKETEWIIGYNSYKSLNPTPETGAKHIQDVLDGKTPWDND